MKKFLPLPKLLVICGSTASGKSALAIALAKKNDGEIISADSRQFYRGMDIGAGIVEGEWKKIAGKKVYVSDGIPHYLLAFRSPKRHLVVSEFQKLAIKKIYEIFNRGKLPILVGGTGLYIRAVVDNFHIPKVAPNTTLRKILEKKTSAQLFALLKKKDPLSASKIAPQNRRYVIRALEVTTITGRPFSEQQQRGEPLFDTLQLMPLIDRNTLFGNIDRRVDDMMHCGLLDEAKKVGRRYGWDLPVLSSLGHCQLGMYLRGELTLEEAVSKIKRETRHYAKRQLTWFRKDGRIQNVQNHAEALQKIRIWR